MTVGLWLSAAIVVFGAVGCGETPSVTSAGGAGSGGTAASSGSGGSGGGGSACPDDPADGAVADACGVWVSASLGNDRNAGTQAAPVATLTHAIKLAQAGAGRVYACAETWSETLVVPGNVSLLGGFDCASDWAYVGGETRSNLDAPGQIAMTWVDGDQPGEPFLTDFHVQAADAVEPGGSSIGVFVRDKVPLWIRRCEVFAGNGADGADGIPGDALPAPAGMPGESGANACSAALSKGGAASANACASGMSKGGFGGDAGPLLAENGGAGEPASEPPDGAGGLGEQSAPSCSNGLPGANGLDGKFGFGGQEKGHLTPVGYMGNPGEDGKPGASAQGGGGGGGVFGSVAVCGAATPGGAAGGSGGGGGCGGKGGGGGQAGGASLGIVARTKIAIEDTWMKTGKGGNGGNGAPPQLGGLGGAPGPGGGGMGAIKPGCAGGKGGTGGKGGWGGGGMGGPVVPLVYLGGEDTDAYGVNFYDYGVAGDGGIGDPNALGKDYIDARGDNPGDSVVYDAFLP